MKRNLDRRLTALEGKRQPKHLDLGFMSLNDLKLIEDHLIASILDDTLSTWGTDFRKRHPRLVKKYARRVPEGFWSDFQTSRLERVALKRYAKQLRQQTVLVD